MSNIPTPTRFTMWCAATHGHVPTAAPTGNYVTFQEYERDLTPLTAERDRLREALREAYEVYAGSDGFVPETAPEGYLQRLVRQMGEILGRALAQQDTQQEERK